MKHSNILFMIAILVFGTIAPAFAQQVMPEVIVKAVRYKYLSAVDHQTVSQPVKILQMRAAQYDVKNTNYYEEDYDFYYVTFYLPAGQILAAYDQGGKLLSTAEKYKNVNLPTSVRNAVAAKYAGWSITSDVYLVTYFEAKGATKVYKLVLANGDKRLRIKINEKGDIL